MKVHQTIALLAAAASLSVAACGSAGAAESITPLQPGATTGVPNAALPPPGLYFNFDTDYAWGVMRNNSGKSASLAAGDGRPNIHAGNVEVLGALLWVPGWKLLGADYGAAIAQPIKFANNTSTEIGDWSARGFVGTVISPLNLSWNLGNGWFVGSGVAIATPDGNSAHTWSATLGKYVLSRSNIANNYWTIEPNLAFTWMKDGWLVSANNLLDFNTTNSVTDYHSGSTYYLDATVAKRFGKWNLGVIGNYTQQLVDDEQFGKAVSNSKAMHLKAGAMASYDFDRFTVTARYLGAVHTQNDVGVSFLHLGVAVKLY